MIRLVALAAIIVVCGFLLGVTAYSVSHPRSVPAAANISPKVDQPHPPGVASHGLTRRTNILIIGTDFPTRDPRFQHRVSRADTLILVTINPRGRRVDAVSIPRDTLVEIQGAGPGKIAEAFAYGGLDLTVQTVEQLLDLPIPYYVQLDQVGFARLIDAIGGVEMEVRTDIHTSDPWTGRRVTIAKGHRRMTGEQALHYIRFRRGALGDIGRVRRQHELLLALSAQVKPSSLILSTPRVVRLLLDHTNTNLSARGLVSLGTFLLRLSPDRIQITTLPGRLATGYWIPDPNHIEQLIRRIFEHF